MFSTSIMSPGLVWASIALNVLPQIDNMTIVGLSGASAGVFCEVVSPMYRLWPNVQTDACYLKGRVAPCFVREWSLGELYIPPQNWFGR